MRKFVIMAAIFTAACATQVSAQQGGGDPAAMQKRMDDMKERMKPVLVDKAKITTEQADKVLNATFAQQRLRREVRQNQDLSQDDKTKRMAELDGARDKEFKSFGLTDEQIKAVNDTMDEIRKQQMQQRQNGGN